MTAEERAIVERLADAEEAAAFTHWAPATTPHPETARALRSLLAAADHDEKRQAMYSEVVRINTERFDKLRAAEARVLELEQKLAGVEGEASYWHDVALDHEANDFQP